MCKYPCIVIHALTYPSSQNTKTREMLKDTGYRIKQPQAKVLCFLLEVFMLHFFMLVICYVLRLSPVDPRMALNFSCSWGIELFIFLSRHSKSWNYEHMPPYLFSSVWGMEPMVSLMLDKHSTKWTVFSLLNVISGNSH